MLELENSLTTGVLILLQGCSQTTELDYSMSRKNVLLGLNCPSYLWGWGWGGEKRKTAEKPEDFTKVSRVGSLIWYRLFGLTRN